MNGRGGWLRWGSTGQLAQEVAFVHAIFEGFAAVDEDYGDLVGELAAELFVGVDIDFLPAEQAAALKLYQTFFHDFAQMAALASVNENFSRVGHPRSLAFSRQISIVRNVKKFVTRPVDVRKG